MRAFDDLCVSYPRLFSFEPTVGRRPCRFGGARRPRAWCRRRPAALAAPRRAASVTSRALRGVFWHVRAWDRRQEARLPCLRPRACERARQARRRSARVFELATRDEPAWLVAPREPAQHALGTLYSLDKLSGKVPAGLFEGRLNFPTSFSSRAPRRLSVPTAGGQSSSCSHVARWLGRRMSNAGLRHDWAPWHGRNSQNIWRKPPPSCEHVAGRTTPAGARAQGSAWGGAEKAGGGGPKPQP